MPPDLLVAVACGSHVVGGVLLLLLCRLVVVDACLVRVVGLGREDGMRQVQREWGGWLEKGGEVGLRKGGTNWARGEAAPPSRTS